MKGNITSSGLGDILANASRRRLLFHYIKAALVVPALKVGGARSSENPVSDCRLSTPPNDIAGIMGDGRADDTHALQKLVRNALKDGRCVDLGDTGTYLTSGISLNDPDIPDPTATSGQREIVSRFRGYGGQYSGPAFKALAKASGRYVLRGLNGIGINVGGFRVDGSRIANGVNLAFLGNASTNSAPSNGSHISDIWIQDFLDVGINLDQCHDSNIYGIYTRDGYGHDPVACYFRGGGGFLAMHDCTFYGGRVVMACQNGALENIVLQSLELTYGSYNHVDIRSCHFIATSDLWGAINSTATGNATRAINVQSCCFVADLKKGYIRGRFWQGGKFTNCQFSANVLTSSIISAGGRNQLPVFIFENCSFDGASHVNDLKFDENAIHIYINCRLKRGDKFTGASKATSLYPYIPVV